MLLLVGPFVKTVGGSEATYGMLCAAAAAPTAGVLLLLLRFPRDVPAHRLLAGSCGLYAGAALLVSAMHSLNVQLVAASIVLGTAWAVAYTAAPMIASDLAVDNNRATLIGYATGTIQVGFGIGPVLGNALRRADFSYQQVFLAGALLAAGAALLVVPLGVQLRRVAAERDEAGRATATPGPVADAADDREPAGAADVRPDTTPSPAARWPHPSPAPRRRSPLRSPSAVPLAMVLLCACVFTTMNSFQTTFADSHGLDFDLFYVTYTVAVITVRLGLSRFLADSASDRVVAATTVGMTVAAVAFAFVGSNAALYVVASALLGCTYGLGLPAFQARAVNLADAADRVRMLPMAGLLFEVAILVFPVVAGLIVGIAGYQGLSAVLVAIACAIAVLGQLPRRPRPSQESAAVAPGSVSRPDDLAGAATHPLKK
ncbi:MULTISPECIES: MFS transporter [Protofrankia]|uniref:Major Facilitator Superfamily protein n=1 Tax=Protofrankia coriariae TaxID=1562887 RepID=A0ABR5F3E4_9ACTN|nr:MULTISPECIES: MFS transporter [Protofrankia]KLL11220.1 hypothetical protein FrCorBMG51_12370 [Protofrankia coriariae]ONH33757.1 hypothetical protein BL254_19375 [Protofrankia sp. BMG5.30]